jgi:hypothetical protein
MNGIPKIRDRCNESVSRARMIQVLADFGPGQNRHLANWPALVSLTDRRTLADFSVVIVSQLVHWRVGVEKLSTNWAIFMRSVWQPEAFSGIV